MRSLAAILLLSAGVTPLWSEPVFLREHLHGLADALQVKNNDLARERLRVLQETFAENELDASTQALLTRTELLLTNEGLASLEGATLPARLRRPWAIYQAGEHIAAGRYDEAQTILETRNPLLAPEMRATLATHRGDGPTALVYLRMIHAQAELPTRSSSPNEQIETSRRFDPLLRLIPPERTELQTILAGFHKDFRQGEPRSTDLSSTLRDLSDIKPKAPLPVRATVYPARTTSGKLLEADPDGLLLELNEGYGEIRYSWDVIEAVEPENRLDASLLTSFPEVGRQGKADPALLYRAESSEEVEIVVASVYRHLQRADPAILRSANAWLLTQGNPKELLPRMHLIEEQNGTLLSVPEAALIREDVTPLWDNPLFLEGLLLNSLLNPVSRELDVKASTRLLLDLEHPAAAFLAALDRREREIQNAAARN